jgi:predicted O-linked N-acetylglucosamine transferase (SPINDLY family)
MTKANFGLPDGFLFCSFNQSYKIDETVLKSWIKILKKVPNSSLCLLDQNKIATKNIKSEGPGLSHRILFFPKLPKAQHLARLSLCDLSLDTFICNGMQQPRIHFGQEPQWLL